MNWTLKLTLTSCVCLGFSGFTSASPIPSLDCVINPSEIVELSAPVSGIIESLNVRRSDRVEKAQLLVQLDNQIEHEELKIATHLAQSDTGIELRKAALELAQKTRMRSEELRQKALITDQEQDQLDTDIRLSQLNLQMEKNNKTLATLEQNIAKKRLAQKTINSPFDGVVTTVFKSVGERVDEEPILRLAKLDPLHVEVIVPANLHSAIEIGMGAVVRPAHDKNQTIQARVDRIDKLMDPASGTFGVQLSIPNPDLMHTAGVLCELRFETASN